MKFVCKRCGYQTNVRQALIKHLQRKNPCKTLLEDVPIHELLEESRYVKEVNEDSLPCEYCSQLFNDRSNLHKHKQICKRNPTNEMQALKQEIQVLKTQIQDNKTVSNTTNIQTINNYNIILNNFGKETYDHITDDFIKACINKNLSGIKSLIEKIHFSEEAPENRTVRLRSLKNNLVEVANDQRWVVKDANEAMETMILNGQRILNGYYHNPQSGLLQKELEELDTRIQDFLNSIIDRNSNHYFALRRRILALIIEHSDQM